VSQTCVYEDYQNFSPLSGGGLADGSILLTHSMAIRFAIMRPERDARPNHCFTYVLLLVSVEAQKVYGFDLLLRRKEDLRLCCVRASPCSAQSTHPLF
jgi:hypothetical protein